MEEKGFPTPLLLFAQKSVFDKRSKVDLVLGENDVLVELKMEPDYPGVSKPVVFSTKREAQGSGSVEEDLEKIGAYSAKGKYAHFLMIDEGGRHLRKIPGEWNKTKGHLGPAYYLHKYLGPQ